MIISLIALLRGGGGGLRGPGRGQSVGGGQAAGGGLRRAPVVAIKTLNPTVRGQFGAGNPKTRGEMGENVKLALQYRLYGVWENTFWPALTRLSLQREGGG